jgi:hypothetical protein
MWSVTLLLMPAAVRRNDLRIVPSGSGLGSSTPNSSSPIFAFGQRWHAAK